MNPKKRKKVQLSNLDAQGNATFSRQLEFIRTQNVEMRFPNFMARKLIPVKNDIDEGVLTITWRSYAPAGVAKLISSYADDLPRSDVTAEENTSKVHSIGNSYGFNIDEVAAAAYAGNSLDTKKAAAARRANEQEVERIASTGDARFNILGLLNQPNVLTYMPPAGASTFTDWARKTGPEMLADLLGIVQGIVSTTNGIEKPNTVLLPETQMGLAMTTRIGTVSDTTVAEFFTKTRPGIELLAWERLKGAGASGSDRMIAYYRDPNYLELNIPKEWTELDPQERNLEVVIPCHSRIGGVVLYYPLSMSYGDGI
jgi:hypothetical protein